MSADYECFLSVVGLYIGMKANKRRINAINLWKVPKWVYIGKRTPWLLKLSAHRYQVPSNPLVKQGKVKFAFGQPFHLALQQIHRRGDIVHAEILGQSRILPRHGLVHGIGNVAIGNVPGWGGPQF